MKILRHSRSSASGPVAQTVTQTPAVPAASVPSPAAATSPFSAFRFPAFRFSSRSSSGVALVVTLVLLSVITFMAVTFLVVSTAERRSVATGADQAAARLAAEASLERAVAEIQANILANSQPLGNPFSYDLRVSTNYVSTNGFIAGNSYPTNVHWTYSNGKPLSPADYQQNIANLLYSPRVPVFMTNLLTHTNEFRYYVDLNRNGMFEDTGLFPETNSQIQYFNLTTQAWENFNPRHPYLSNYYVGDPQWIGILERPGQQHSPSNYFVSRIAYLIAPAGKTLDLNYIHNYSKGYRKDMSYSAGDGFLRDQGVGTYEINLAAFLADLNTNYWTAPGPVAGVRYPIYYPLARGTYNQGAAFDDALSLLSYRYGTNYDVNWLWPLQRNFGTNGLADGYYPYQIDYVDETLSGPIMTNLPWQEVDTNYPWAGSDNTNHFFSMQDLFDPTKTAANNVSVSSNFTSRLIAAGAGTNQYNRYTYYRLLAQLGTESAPEPVGRINLNYDNLIHTNANSGATGTTNLWQWNATDFFVTTANRLLTNAGFTFPPLVSFTNPTSLSTIPANFPTNGIQIWPTNQYSPSVHRLLQLAANIYDARTNRLAPAATNGLGYPSIFRPLFYQRQAQSPIYIVGYAETTNTEPAGTIHFDPTRQTNSLQPFYIVDGVPVVIGAKKGWPNFNKLAMQTQILVTRKLQFIPTNTAGFSFVTNQKYLVSLSQALGVQAWNSYSNINRRNFELIASVTTDTTLWTTNKAGIAVTNLNLSLSATNYIITNFWQGYRLGDSANQYSFVVPVLTNFSLLNTNAYSTLTSRFTNYYTDTDFDNPSYFITPRWWLSVRTRVRFSLADIYNGSYRVVDYVNLDSTQDPQQVNYPLEILQALMQNQSKLQGHYVDNFVTGGTVGESGFWVTNRDDAADEHTPNWGVLAQIDVGQGAMTSSGDGDWKPSVVGSPDEPSTTFKNRLKATNDPTVFYSPYDPVGSIFLNTVWQANDPLVHYMVGDLVDVGGLKTNCVINSYAYLKQAMPTNVLVGQAGLSDRYRAWGRNGPDNSETSWGNTLMNMGLKDALITCSDDWDFPTNTAAFPNVGWLGRVHRGTPWQTVYLKAGFADLTTWSNWVGGGIGVTNSGHIATNLVQLWDGKYTNSNLANAIIPDALFSHPMTDYRILDLFSTAMNANMTCGRLSINQTNLAAWSAVLSGVDVLSNTPTGLSNIFIQPAGVYDWGASNQPPLVKMWNGINSNRLSYLDRVLLTNSVLPANSVLAPSGIFVAVTNISGSFGSLGSILCVPELTTNSPFLDLSNAAYLNDAVYERIPQQILGLLQCDTTPRLVVYAYGQALKPAEHSLVTSGSLANLCTNYQVTAEAAIRAVIRIDNPTNNPHAVVEKFNLLGPD